MLYIKLAGIYSEIGQYENALDVYSKVIELSQEEKSLLTAGGKTEIESVETG